MATQKINIAEILEQYPKGTILYSPMVGETNFDYLSDNEDSVEAIWTENKFGEFSFDKYGRYTAGGEMMLFPSNAMRDWCKFAWKKGDVLVNNEGTCECVFDGWYNNDYTHFKAKHWLNSKDENNIRYLSENQPLTSLYMKEDEESEECYVNTIGERFGGKLNLETLEIEKESEFKDGDIVVVEPTEFMCKIICIFKDKKTEIGKLCYYVCQHFDPEITCYNFVVCVEGRTVRLATDEEKQELFVALKKKGMRWDAETKKAVKIPELKPFDKVLTRDEDTDEWSCNIFSHINECGDFICITGETWGQCIPFEGNEDLVGTKVPENLPF